ncbi:sulfotransferase family 2 domain-containing protein [Altibacter sp. HG106]|uniref:sulfotransferase family 2 domain-containing protein n=1 Tax=Altibacter sp. HG106 TaxID=3023937 RepID=UPI002350E107|nr:sulfotransferase family 2 domain-containing protein [Altibacter sp. HG106]MDC7995715.1 sulfotransferase family 2 domain-containing protein [Altibacter sp. HG106]
MISKEREFIFIHNFKTGGTSIEKKLGHFDSLAIDVQDHRSLRDIELLTNRSLYFRKSLYALLKKGKPQRAWQHFQQGLSPELTAAEYERFFKFTFVRNTWARMYSWYANVMKDPHMRQSYRITDLNFSFEAFLTEKIQPETFSQWYFITNRSGVVGMDFIGRFERLQEDFDTVGERLQLEDTQLPKLLVRNYTPYTEAYTSTTKDLVYQQYRTEIDYFSFEFGA